MPLVGRRDRCFGQATSANIIMLGGFYMLYVLTIIGNGYTGKKILILYVYGASERMSHETRLTGPMADTICSSLQFLR